MGAADGTHAARSPLAVALQLSQAGEEQSTCPFPNNGSASAQEARSDLFSLLCPLRPVIKGPSHCLNHFHDSVTSILRSGGRDSKPAQSRRHGSCGRRHRRLRSRVGGLGKGRRALALPFPLRAPRAGGTGIFAPTSFPGPSTHCPGFLVLREAESRGRDCRARAALVARLGSGR